jgi:outer membrane protein TolC
MRRLLLVIMSGSLNLMTFAQTPLLLTLEECIHQSEENSFRLQSDDFEIAVAESNASIAKSSSIPRISGELAIDNRFLEPYYFNQSWASVHADWSLGDLIRKTGRSAQQDIETRRLEKEQHRLDVVGRSTYLYISILQVMKQIEILEVRINFLLHHTKISRGMWEAGLKSQLDLLQTESEIVKLQEDTARLAIIKENLKLELARLMGWESADHLQLAPLNLDSLAASPVPQLSFQDLSRNPILASFDSRLMAQQLRTDEISANQIPHISLGSGYVGDGDPTGDGNYFQINAGVIIPIYSGNAYEYQKQGSKAMSESLDAQRSDAEREIMIHLAKVHEQLVNLKDLMDIQGRRLNISAQTVDFAEVNYEAGIASNLDYLSSQQSLTNTELTIEETRLEYTMSLIEFYITSNQVDQIIAMGDQQNGN